MAVRIMINELQISSSVDSAWEKGLAMLSSQILKDCNFYCKKDTGALINSSLIHSDLKRGKLVWNTPYAARQYYEIRTAYTDENPNATWRWVDYAKSRHLADWNRQAQEITRKYR